MINYNKLREEISFLAAALPHFDVFPVTREKKPTVAFSKTVTSGSILIQMLHQGGGCTDAQVAKIFQTGHYGVRGGASDGSSGPFLVVLDIDVKGTVNGNVTLSSLESHNEPLPETFEVTTRSGGRHLYFLSDLNIRSRNGSPGPGLDTKAHHGYVLGPGSVGYTVTNPSPVAPLPKWLQSLMSPVTSQQLAAADSSIAVEFSVIKTAEDLLQVAESERGIIPTFWRNAVNGLRVVQAYGSPLGPPLPAKFGGVDDLLTRAFFWLANQGDWAHVAPKDFLPLFSRSLHLLCQDDKHYGNDVYTEAQIEEKWHRAAYKAQVAQAEIRDFDPVNNPPTPTHITTADPIDLVDMETTPYLVQFRKASYILREDRESYFGPVDPIGLVPAMAHLTELPIVRINGNGEERAITNNEILRRFGRYTQHPPVYSLERSTTTYDPEADVLTIGMQGRRPTPEYSEPIDNWLMSMCPDDRLLHWIRFVRQPGCELPALWFTDQFSVGKRLFAKGVAQLLGFQEPRELVHFRAKIPESYQPAVIFLDGHFPIQNRKASVPNFLGLLSRTRTVGNSPYVHQMVGSPRVIVGISRGSDFFHNADLSDFDSRALLSHVYEVSLPDPISVEQSLRHIDVQNEWVLSGALGRHFAWVEQQYADVQPRGPLSIAPRATMLRSRFGVSFGIMPFMCQILIDWLRQYAVSGVQPPGLIHYRYGEFMVVASYIREQLDESVHEGCSLNRIGRDLSRLCVPGLKRFVHADMMTYRVVDLEKLRTWASTSGEVWCSVEEFDTILESVRKHAKTQDAQTDAAQRIAAKNVHTLS